MGEEITVSLQEWREDLCNVMKISKQAVKSFAEHTEDIINVIEWIEDVACKEELSLTEKNAWYCRGLDIWILLEEKFPSEMRITLLKIVKKLLCRDVS